MTFEATVNRAALVKALSHVALAVQKRSIIPILSHVRLTPQHSGFLQLEGTNLDQRLTESVPAAAIGDAICVDCPRLLNFLKSTKAEEARLWTVDTADNARELIIQCQTLLIQLPTGDAKNFPDARVDGEEYTCFDLTPAQLSFLLDKTASCISTESSHFYLTGIFFHAYEGQLRAVATDGHRLACASQPLPVSAETEDFTGDKGFIVPYDAVAMLRKLLVKATANIGVSWTATGIHFAGGTWDLETKAIDGTFPAYMRVVPKDNPNTLSVDRSKFMDALANARQVEIDRRGKAVVKLTLANGDCALTASGDGSATETFVASWFTGQFVAAAPIEIGFYSRYLAEMLASMDGNAVRFAISDPLSPAVITDPGEAELFFVLMPMRFSDAKR